VVIIGTGLFFGWYNNKVVPLYPKAHFHYVQEPTNPLSYMSNWDGPDYLGIAKSGYTSLFQANFFPLYPMAIYAVDRVIPSPLDSALLISWVCLVGAAYFYMKVVRTVFSVKGKSEPLKALLFFVFFPTGVFLIATYTESLYALLALGSIYYAFQKRIVLTAGLALLCTATHVTGVFVVILVSAILLEEKARFLKAFATLVVGSLGLVGYMTYLQIKFHNPFAFIQSQEQIHGWLQYGYSNLLTTADFFNVLFLILLVVSAVYWWKRRKSFSLYSILFIFLPFVGRQFGGFNRYVLMAFPMQFMLYEYFTNKKTAFPYIAALLGVTWTYILLQYAGGYIGS
jgi:Gpi18-like mannosyltransferase